MTNPDDVILSDEAAAILDCDRSTVNRQAKAGALKFIRKLDGIRGAYLFRRGDVEAFAEQKRAA